MMNIRSRNNRIVLWCCYAIILMLGLTQYYLIVYEMNKSVFFGFLVSSAATTAPFSIKYVYDTIPQLTTKVRDYKNRNKLVFDIEIIDKEEMKL